MSETPTHYGPPADRSNVIELWNEHTMPDSLLARLGAVIIEPRGHYQIIGKPQKADILSFCLVDVKNK